MSSLRFIGLSGPLKFKGADRIGNSVIRQIQGGSLTDIAIFDCVKSSLDFDCKTCKNLMWINGRAPVAQRILKVSLIIIPDVLFYIILLVSVMGIGASILFFCFNLHFRKIKSVKLSSPALNNVAVSGCIFVYSSVILSGFHNTTRRSTTYFSELCSVRVYLLSAGFSLAFGSMFAKTYRVHRLFTYIGAGLVKDKLLKDKQLIAFVLIPLIVDALILTLWVTIDPMEKQLHNLSLEISSSDRGIVYQPQVEVCHSHNTMGWYIALFGYKSILLIMGVFMAWKTRHIKVPFLNDSQHIGISVYSAMFCTIIVILSSFTSNHVILTYVAKSTSILASTTVTLVLLFLPKIRSVLGKNQYVDPIIHSMGLKVECNTRRFIWDDPRELIYRLEIQNKVYRCEVSSLDKEIGRLEELLGSSSRISIGSTADCHHLSVPGLIGRASWPNAHDTFKIPGTSEDELNSDQVFEKTKWLGKVKRLFGSFHSVHASDQSSYQANDLFRMYKSDILTLRSTTEVLSDPQIPITSISLVKAKSETNIC